IGDALETIVERGDLVAPLPDDQPARPSAVDAPPPVDTDPAIVSELIEQSEASLAELREQIDGLSGPALLDFVLADVPERRQTLFDPRSLGVVMAAMQAAWWLNERLEEWLGEKNAADGLTQSVAHNVTSEMGLALLDVADAVRPHPEV